MAIIKEFLSGSTNGKPVQITGTASGSQNTIHTGHATAKDEVWLWATNNSGTDAVLTVAIGTTATTGELLLDEVIVTANSTPTPIMAGWIINNSVTITAFTTTGSDVNVIGFVNRIS